MIDVDCGGMIHNNYIDKLCSSGAMTEGNTASVWLPGNPASVLVVSTVIVLVRGPPSAPTAAAAPAAGARRSFVTVFGLLDVKATFSHFRLRVKNVLLIWNCHQCPRLRQDRLKKVKSG